MKRPLRICMITTFYPPFHFGGDGIFIYRLSNKLAERGHYVDVIHYLEPFYALNSNKRIGQFTNHPNVTVHSIRSWAGVISILLIQQTGHPFFIKNKIKRILENRQFDVIHFHNTSLIGGPDILHYGNAIKLYTMHEYWLVCPTHVLFKFNREACVKTSCFICTILYRRPPQIWRYSNKLTKSLNSIDTFISPSKFAHDMHKKMGLDIPTVQIPMFAPKPAEPNDSNQILGRFIDPEQPYFLFVGRIEKLKGIQDLIPIFKRYNYAKLLIAGTGTYKEKLESLSNNNPQLRIFLV